MPERHDLSNAMTIHLHQFPQLRFIAWNMRDCDTLDDREAFSIYERNWRFVEQTQPLTQERALIARLRDEFGAGVMNV
jgi:hypothetical protein